MDRRIPPIDLRPRPRHALVLIDVVVIAAIFMLGGELFMRTKGAEHLQNSERLREVARQHGSRQLEEADSVATVARASLAEMVADSAQLVIDLEQRRLTLEATIAEQQTLNQGLFGLSDNLLDLRDRSATSSRKVQEYEKELANRREEHAELTAKANAAQERLDQVKAEREQTAEAVQQARRARTYEPIGIFPSKSGVMVSRELAQENGLSNIDLQHNVMQAGLVDVGLAVGVGFGTGDVSSTKQVGLLLSRSLIHRRLGIDLGAGYSILTDAAGADDAGGYALMSLRLSPFYRERFHFGLGARANQDEVMPFLGVGIGRR